MPGPAHLPHSSPDPVHDELPLSGDELFRTIVDATDGMVFVVDLSHPELRPLYLSPRAEELLASFEQPRDGRSLAATVHPEDRDDVVDALRRAVERQERIDLTFRVCPRDGTELLMRCRAVVLPATDEHPPLAVGTAADVTELHRGRERAELDAVYHRSLVEQIPGIVYRLTNEAPVARVTYMSPQVEDVFGHPSPAWIDEPSSWVDALHPDDRDRVLATWAHAVESGEPYVDEFRLLRPDGGTVWLRERLLPIRDADGDIIEWQGLTIDMTEARSSEEARALSDERYRVFVEHAPALVFTMDAEGGVIYVGPQLHSMLGYAGEPWRDDPNYWVDLIHPDDRDDVVATWREAVRGRTPYRKRYRMLHADGSTVWLQEHSHPSYDEDGNVRFWQGLALDVTAAREAEAALEASETRYRALIEQLPAVVYVASDHEVPRHLFVSEAATEMLGYSPESYLDGSFSWSEAIHPDDAPRAVTGWHRSVRTGEPYEYEYRHVKPDGEIVWVRDTCVPIETPDGTRMWEGVILDVSRQVVAEREADAAAARYRALVEGIPAVVYEMGPDEERRALYVGPQIEQLLGYTREEWLEQPDIWIELLHPDDREIELAAHDRHNETGDPWGREYRLIAADGRVVWVRDQAFLVTDPDGRSAWQGVLLDITAQKEAEAELRHAKDELEFRVAARTSQLEDANELMSLEITERRRIEHELRRTEERFRRLVEDMPAVLYRWQTTPTTTGIGDAYVSPHIEQMLGYTPDEWHQPLEFWRTRLHPHDRARVEAEAERAAATGEPFEIEFRYLARDGRVVHVLDRASLLTRDDAGRPLVYQGVLVDVTAWRLAEEKAAEAEERFREVTEAAPATTYVLELAPDGGPPTVHSMSSQIEHTLGFPVERWLTDPLAWREIVHPDDVDRVLATAAASFASGAPWAMDYRVFAADGRVVWLHSRGRCAARDDDGRPLRFVGVLLDVTEREETAARIGDDLATASALLEGMPGVPWTELVDPESGWRRLAYLGPQTLDLFGYTPEELIGEPNHYDRMLHPDDKRRVLERSRRAERTGELWVDEFRLLARDGTVRFVHSTGRRVSPPGVVPAVWQGVTVDLTDVPPSPQVPRAARVTSRLGRRSR